MLMVGVFIQSSTYSRHLESKYPKRLSSLSSPVSTLLPPQTRTLSHSPSHIHPSHSLFTTSQRGTATMPTKTNIPQWQQRASLHNASIPSPISPPSPTSSNNMFTSLKNSLRSRSRSRSNSSMHSSHSNDERTVQSPAELAAAARLAPPRSPLLNPSPPTRRPDRPGMNAFTVPSNEPPPAYTPSPTTASGPTLGASPAYTPSGSRERSPVPEPAVRALQRAMVTGEDRFTFLKQFDTILLIDDSGSMMGRSWGETSQALSQLLPTIVERDADGIDIFFLNHVTSDPGFLKGGVAPGGYRNVTTVAEVERIFSAVVPYGGTPTGVRCRAILKPYLAHLEEMAKKGKIDDVKPLNILVITDGEPSDDVESVLIAAAKKLDALEAAPHQVGVQFFQVGNQPGAAAALRELDDGLVGFVRGGVRDIVDTCTWTGGENGGGGPMLTADGILKVVLGAVVKRIDRTKLS